jgi:RNA recognition motif-containing protein
VRFSTKEDAEAAIAKVNNTELEGRPITVRLDRYA